MGCREAVEALQAEAAHNDRLVGFVYLGISFSSPPVEERSHFPLLCSLPHKFRRSDDTCTCLVVKDPSGSVIKELRDSRMTDGLFDEVIGVGKLRRRLGKSGSREFGKAFTTIFVQDKVLRPLESVLGLSFYAHSRHLPVVITLGDPAKVRHQVRATLKSTQFVLRPQKYHSVIVGHTKMNTSDLVENVQAALAFAAKLGSAKCIIKSPESTSLPVSLD